MLGALLLYRHPLPRRRIPGRKRQRAEFWRAQWVIFRPELDMPVTAAIPAHKRVLAALLDNTQPIRYLAARAGCAFARFDVHSNPLATRRA